MHTCPTPEIRQSGRSALARTLSTVLVITALVAPVASSAQPLAFSDSLAGPASPNLTIPAGKYGYGGGGLQRIQSSSRVDRPMVFTNSGAYLTAANFTADLTVTLATDDLLYFGFGQGDADPGYHNEPSHGFYFRVHSRFDGHSYDIHAAARSSPSSFHAINTIGTYALNSTITLRIVRAGDNVTLSIVGGGSATYSISPYPALGLTNTNSRIFFGNTTVGTVFSNLNITVPPPAPLALGDIVGGGDGRGNGVYNTGIVARDGTAASPPWANEGVAVGFRPPVSGSGRINGVFVPSGTTQVATTGLSHAFPITNGHSWDAIRNGVSTMETNGDVNPIYDASGAVTTVGVGIHANAGITFDLVQIAAIYPGQRASSFTGNVGGKPSPIRCGTGDPMAHVLIDGVPAYSKQVGLTPNTGTLFNITIPAGARFLTLATTDNGNGNGCDKAYFANALLHFSPVPTDSTPPVISAPANIVVEATSSAGATVNYTATAVDDVDGNVPVTLSPTSPSSGSTFPLGTTTVNLTASDAAGNNASASFTVTVQDTIAPVIILPPNVVAEATGPGGAVVNYTAATATDAVGVTSLTHSPASGSTFPLGTTPVTVTAKDAAGHTTTASFTVKVQDTTAPTIASVTPSAGSLWPANHKMVAVSLSVVATDLVSPTTTATIVSVTSNEPTEGLGDGDTPVDWQITGPLTVNLRAERSGKGSGRTYTITVKVSDAAGNQSTGSCTVSVPKNQAK